MNRAVRHSQFLLVGAGGLGGPIAYALAAAGAGRLILCDDDQVELSNLHRQVQFATSDIGRLKVEALADALERRGYSRGKIERVVSRFDEGNARALAGDADLVIDGSDNYSTKFLLNDTAVRARIPFVIAAVARYGGQVLAVSPGATGCYRCIFEEPPGELEGGPTCAEAGVFAPAVAVIAGVAAKTALALCGAERGAEAAAGGELLVYDDLRQAAMPRRIRFGPRVGCTACAARSEHVKEAT